MKTAFQAKGEARTFREILDRLDTSHYTHADGHDVQSVHQPQHKIEEERRWVQRGNSNGFVNTDYYRWVYLYVAELDEQHKVTGQWKKVGRFVTPYDDECEGPMEERETFSATAITFENEIDLKTANYVVRMLEWDWRTDD